MSREFTIENEYLKLTVTTWGAQVKSVVRKCDGVEHIWQAEESVWGYHAPILFPHCGRVAQNKILAKGQEFEAGPHGFARKMEHEFVDQTKDTIVLELCANEKTMKVFPYDFRLVSTFALAGDTLCHTLTVENNDLEEMPFGIGFHPGFNVPFDDRHTLNDYELRFEKMESPLCINNLPHGLMHGNFYYLGSNIIALPINEALFANDSHCMTNLTSKTLGIYEKDTGRAVVCDIGDFPYTLIWSMPGGDPKFVCIEPWHSLPSPERSSTDWLQKPAAAILAPGESWSTTLRTRFQR